MKTGPPSTLGLSLASFGARLALLRVPVVGPFHHFFLLVAVAFLDPPDKFVVIAFDLHQVVVSELALLFFHFAFELHPLSFELIGIHRDPPCCDVIAAEAGDADIAASPPRLCWAASRNTR